MSISMLGIDTAKSVFHLQGVDAQGKVQLKRKLRRDELIPFFGNCSSLVSFGVGREAWTMRLT